MGFNSNEEELQALDVAIDDVRERVAGDFGGFKELRAAAKKGDERARQELEDFDNLRARREVVAKHVRGFT